jgi:hypothetical protein
VVKQHLLVGLARGLDRNYKRFVVFENGAWYLADPEHHTPRGVLRGGLDGDQDLLQEELDLMRKHSAMPLEWFRAIENEMERGPHTQGVGWGGGGG